jgi:hypothetical protein
VLPMRQNVQTRGGARKGFSQARNSHPQSLDFAAEGQGQSVPRRIRKRAHFARVS